jgi:hypothetical protein
LQRFSWTIDTWDIFLMQWFPLAFCMIVFRHTVGLVWTSDQPVSETSTCTGQHNIETQVTNIHALSGIRTLDTSNQAAADLRLRPRGYRLAYWVMQICILSRHYVFIHCQSGISWCYVVNIVFILFVHLAFNFYFVFQNLFLEVVCTNYLVLSCHYDAFCFSLNVS